MENLRRLYNIVDRFLDRHSLAETIQRSRSGGEKYNPITASEALSLCVPLVREIERGACLKLIVSPDGSIQRDGRSARWEFFFDLPQRRAKILCVWHLLWNEEKDDFGEAQIDITVNPFPPPNSPPRQMVKEGKLLYRQLIGMWRKEQNRRDILPDSFRDSDEVIVEFARKGLDLSEKEITLRAEWVANELPRWYADSRDVSLHCSFE